MRQFYSSKDDNNHYTAKGHPMSQLDESELNRLASLSLIQYEQERLEAAKNLGVRPSILDKDIKERRKKSFVQSDKIQKRLEEMNQKYFVAREGDIIRVYTETEDPMLKVTSLVAMKSHAFIEYYLSEKYQVDEKKQDSIGNIWFHWNERRRYMGILLDPKRDHDGYYNLWRGFGCESVAGDCSLYKRHIYENLCYRSEKLYDYFMKWMATAVQFPNKPAGVAIVLKGGKGTGKSIVARHFIYMFGKHGMHISSGKHLSGNFNAHQRHTIALFADEAFWAGDKQHESNLKALITEPTLSIEAKGKDIITVPNMLHVIMASNADWVIPATADERRFFVLQLADGGHVQNTAYFTAIEDQMNNGGRSALLHELQNIDLTDFDIRKIPDTTALCDQKLQSMDDFTQWWMSCLEAGAISGSDWDCVESAKTYTEYLKAMERRSINRRLGEVSFGMALKKVLPRAWPRKRRALGVAGDRRLYYEFPALETCRRFFCELMKIEIIWDEEEMPR